MNLTKKDFIRMTGGAMTAWPPGRGRWMTA